WFGSDVEVTWSLHAGNANSFLRFLIKGLQIFVADRPVIADAIHGFEPEVLGSKTRGGSAPMHRQAAHTHAARLNSNRSLRSNMIVGIRILVVIQESFAPLVAFAKVEDLVSGLDDSDLGCRALG